MKNGMGVLISDRRPPRQSGPSAARSISPEQLFEPRQNSFLASMPDSELVRLADNLELVSLKTGQELFRAGDSLDAVYFPLTAIISLLYVMASGATTEVAMIGHEGVAGTSLFVHEQATNSAVVQHPGYSYRLKTHFLREAFFMGGQLPELLMRYSNSLFTQIALNTVGSQHSSVEQKLCRWLLDRQDRTRSSELKVTQDLIALMLGVRRESITAAARKLQREGLIHYRRGRVTVADRIGLENQAGECYRVGRAKFTAR